MLIRVENVKEVRKRLKALIEELHLSQTAFAKMVGLDASNLIKKLKGQIAITTNDMNAVNYPQAKDLRALVCG